MNTPNSNPKLHKLAVIFLALLAMVWRPATGAPVVPANGIVNSASYQAPGSVVPGEIIAVFGTDVATSIQLAGSVPLPTTLGGATVTIGGVQAPFFYSSPTQLNLQVPWEVASMTNPQMVVQTTSASNPVPLTVLQSQPGIYTTDQSGTGQGAVLIANSASLAAPVGAFPGSRPVRRGEYIEIFSTGLGPVANTPTSGAATPNASSTLVFPPTVTIGGAPATVSFAGLAPGFVGLYQVNVQVPQGSSTGSAVPVVLFAGSNANNATIAVDPIPSVTGTYNGTGTATVTSCSDPADNGTFNGVGITIDITSQFQAGGFTGNLTATTSVQGITIQILAALSGTVDTSGNMTGSLSGDEFVNGIYDSSFDGTFTGSLNGNILTIQGNTQEVGGTCRTAISATLSR